MHKVRTLRIAGFRRLREVKLDMRPLMVLIGANGVGKSSILDAVSLFSGSASGSLNKMLNSMGGVAESATRGEPKEIHLETEMECQGDSPLRYQLQIEAFGHGYRIATESLSQSHGEQYPAPFKHIDSVLDDVKYYDVETKQLRRPDWVYSPLESALSQVPRMFRQPEELRQTLGSATQYHVLDVGGRSPVKLPQQLKPASLPGENGEDLIPFLYNLRESDRGRFEVVEDTLRVAFPGFESLAFPSAATGMLSLTWKEKHFRDPMFAHQLSEGTLRFIWLTALLQSPNLSTITMIDEPEVSLHPELLSLLADMLREASRRTQVIVATHSDRLVRFLDPSEVVVMDISEDGNAQVQWADEMELDEWLKDYTLDEVWRMGRIGGRA